jgi:hypothetical protein
VPFGFGTTWVDVPLDGVAVVSAESDTVTEKVAFVEGGVAPGFVGVEAGMA